MSASSSPLSTSDQRRHFLFIWPCGCPFSVMTRDHGVTETNAWIEALETDERVEAAREAGVRMVHITHQEWRNEWEAKFKAKCGHPTPILPPVPKDAPEEGGPKLKFKNAADGSLQIEVDDDSEVLVRQFVELLDEGSKYWDHLGALVERLSPGISPYDRREAVAEALAPLKMVITDAFW